MISVCYFTEALVFQLKKRPPDFMPKKGLKQSDRMGPVHGPVPPEKLPYLVELSPGASLTHMLSGSDINH